MDDYNGRRNIGTGVRWDAAADDNGRVHLLQAHADFETLDEANAFVARFPKSYRIHANQLYTFDRKDGNYTNYVIATIELRVHLTPDKVTGEVNEAGLKRFRSFIAACKKQGIEITRVYGWGNSSEFEC